MSVRLDWIDADYMGIEALLSDDEAMDGQRVDSPEQIGLQIIGDSGVVIVGTVDDLRQFAKNVSQQIDAAEKRLQERKA